MSQCLSFANATFELGRHGFCYADSDLSIRNDRIRMHSLNYYNPNTNQINHRLHFAQSKTKHPYHKFHACFNLRLNNIQNLNEFISDISFPGNGREKTRLILMELDAWIEQVKGLAWKLS